MTLALTITLFAPETDDDRKITIGLPHTVHFDEPHRLQDFAGQIGLADEVMRILCNAMIDSVLIDRNRLWWKYTPSPDGPEQDTIRRKEDSVPLPLSYYKLSAADCQTLRALRSLVPIVGPMATLSIATVTIEQGATP